MYRYSNSYDTDVLESSLKWDSDDGDGLGFVSIHGKRDGQQQAMNDTFVPVSELAPASSSSSSSPSASPSPSCNKDVLDQLGVLAVAVESLTTHLAAVEAENKSLKAGAFTVDEKLLFQICEDTGDSLERLFPITTALAPAVQRSERADLPQGVHIITNRVDQMEVLVDLINNKLADAEQDATKRGIEAAERFTKLEELCKDCDEIAAAKVDKLTKRVEAQDERIRQHQTTTMRNLVKLGSKDTMMFAARIANVEKILDHPEGSTKLRELRKDCGEMAGAKLTKCVGASVRLRRTGARAPGT